MSKLLCVLILASSFSPALAVKGKHARFRSRGARYFRGMKLRGAQASGGIPEQLEMWQDHGKTVRCTLSDDSLTQLASQIDAEVYSKELHDLVDERFSRFVAHKGNSNTAEYIEQQFKDMGLTVNSQKIEDSRIEEQISQLVQTGEEVPAKHRNVIGFLKGGDKANEIVLLGGHYDSVNWDDTSDTAPGVDDNGSGSALVLAIARAITSAGDKYKPRRSIMFVAFNAEEEGLVGSEHFVKMFQRDGEAKYGDLKAALIADEVAWPGRGSERRKVIFETKGNGDATNAMVDTLATMAMLQNSSSSVLGDGIGDGKEHGFLVNYHGFGSDHIPFLDAGYPAVLLIERDDDYHADTYGHSARDTFDHVDLDYGAAVTRLAMRSVCTLASPKDWDSSA